MGKSVFIFILICNKYNGQIRLSLQPITSIGIKVLRRIAMTYKKKKIKHLNQSKNTFFVITAITHLFPSTLISAEVVESFFLMIVEHVVLLLNQYST